MQTYVAPKTCLLLDALAGDERQQGMARSKTLCQGKLHAAVTAALLTEGDYSPWCVCVCVCDGRMPGFVKSGGSSNGIVKSGEVQHG